MREKLLVNVDNPLSDEDINNFKLRFIKMIEDSEKIIEFSKSLSESEDGVGDDNTLRFCIDSANAPIREISIRNAKTTILNSKNALLRIENKSFGICYESEKPIPKYQLEANPFLTRIANPRVNTERN